MVSWFQSSAPATSTTFSLIKCFHSPDLWFGQFISIFSEEDTETQRTVPEAFCPWTPYIRLLSERKEMEFCSEALMLSSVFSWNPGTERMAWFQSAFPEAICLGLFLTPRADVTILGSLIFEGVEIWSGATLLLHTKVIPLTTKKVGERTHSFQFKCFSKKIKYGKNIVKNIWRMRP